MLAKSQDVHDVLQALARRRWALCLFFATGCSSRSSLRLHGPDSSIDAGAGTSRDGTIGQSGDSSGGMFGTGGAVRTGGAPGSGGIGGMGGTAGSGGILGMPCTAKQDCPSSATCCDGSDPSCDGTRLPSGDSANPGEFVVSADGVTVTDTITGLVWQRDGSGTRAVCTTDSSNLRCLWAEAEAYCASLVLGGLSGWRLPGWMELLTIVDPTMDATSTINQTAFPNTVTDPYWTSSLFGVFQTKLYISFSDSTVGYCNDTIRRVRCVRGSRCYPTARFSVLDGGLVRDTLTGLVWQQQGSATAMNWADAKNYCSSLVSGGPGFRLPTLKELDSLVDPTVASGATLDKTAFPSTGTKLYWTSSPLGPDASLSGRALCGDFSMDNSNSCTNGPENTAKVADKLMVRCVR